jgi:hypothetical protein
MSMNHLQLQLQLARQSGVPPLAASQLERHEGGISSVARMSAVWINEARLPQ